jgi:hypothetical protein
MMRLRRTPTKRPPRLVKSLPPFFPQDRDWLRTIARAAVRVMRDTPVTPESIRRTLRTSQNENAQTWKK